METMLERVARAIAKDNGDDFNAIPQDKQDWIANHSATGRFRDVNEPRRDDYLSMARAAIEAMRPVITGETLLIEAAAVEAKYDGRDFHALGRADNRRYVERLAITINAYIDAALSQDTHSPSPLNPPADEEGTAASFQEQKP